MKGGCKNDEYFKFKQVTVQNRYKNNLSSSICRNDSNRKL